MKLSKRKNPPASEESVMRCQNASSLSCGGSVSSAARTRRPAANANNNNATAAMRRCLLIRINILVTARVQSLFDPFGVALREPALLDEAVRGFPEQVHISLPGSIQLDDSSRIERHLVPDLTACSRTGTVCEVNRIGNIDIRSPNAIEAVPELICGDDVLRCSRIRQTDSGSARRGNSLLHPLVEIVESGIEN